MLRGTTRAGALFLVFGLLACGGTGRDDAAAAGDTVADVQPRTDAEIQRQSEPMTPEQAEQLGVIDTTIQVTEEP